MKKYLLEIFLMIFIIIPFIYLGINYDTLPERVPTHFGLDGTANGWSDKSTLWVMPAGLCAFLYVLMFLIPVLDPKKRIALMGKKYNQLRAIFAIFFSLLSIYLIYISKEGSLENPNVFFAILGLLFLMFGNYLQALRENYFFGIRTPWTLESEVVWRKTHRLGARLWVSGGLLTIILSAVIRNSLILGISFLVIVGIMSIIPIVYSYIEYRKEQNKL
jgi:uncharacterized membrane protein